MYMEYETFEKVMDLCRRVFDTWDEQMKEFTILARDRASSHASLFIRVRIADRPRMSAVTRKRQEKFIQIKIVAAHGPLQERLAYLRSFRKQHEQLRVMTGPKHALKGLGGDALTDIDMAKEVTIAVRLSSVTFAALSPVEPAPLPSPSSSTRSRTSTSWTSPRAGPRSG